MVFTGKRETCLTDDMQVWWAICSVDGLGTGCHLAVRTLDDGVTNHVSCGATVDGRMHWVVCIEHVQVWWLASLYAEDMAAWAWSSVISVTDWFIYTRSGLGFRGIIKDVGNLPGFVDVLVVLFWEETTFTQEMGVIRMAGLFAQRAGPGWIVGSGVILYRALLPVGLW